MDLAAGLLATYRQVQHRVGNGDLVGNSPWWTPYISYLFLLFRGGSGVPHGGMPGLGLESYRLPGPLRAPPFAGHTSGPGVG